MKEYGTYLKHQSFSVKQIDSLYASTLGNMKKLTAKYQEDVKYGKNRKALLKWNEFVQSNLGIDNLKIFQDINDKQGELFK